MFIVDVHVPDVHEDESNGTVVSGISVTGKIMKLRRA